MKASNHMISPNISGGLLLSELISGHTLFQQISEWRLGKNKLKSKMEIDPAMPKDAGYYECQSDNKFSIDRRGFIAKYELN